MSGQLAVARRGRNARAFTLLEMLVSVAVLVILILIATQLINGASAITTVGNKHVDADTQARTVLDRVAVDFAKMLKRKDVDYYLKGPTNYAGHGNGHGYGNKVQTGQQGSDQIAFYSQVPGYYPASGAQSPVSLVAYRINGDSTSPAYLKFERMGKGLLWNGVSTLRNNPTSPVVFSPVTLATPWPAATLNDGSGNSKDTDYETIGPQVFRLEYYYLLKSGKLTDVPWDTDAGHTSINGLADIEAIGVAIAVIDPASRSLVSNASLYDLASDLADFRTAPGRGVGGAKTISDLENSWNTSLNLIITNGRASTGSPVPRAAASSIRIYGRSFDLKIL